MPGSRAGRGERRGERLGLEGVAESAAVRLGEPLVGRLVGRAVEARERLVAGHAAGAEVDDRLEGDRERVRVLEHGDDLGALLVAADEPDGRLVSRSVGLGQLRRVDGEAALAVALGVVHREIAAAQEILDVADVGAADRHADAGPDDQRLSGDVDRRLQRRERRVRPPPPRAGRRSPRAGRRTRRRRAAPRCRPSACTRRAAWRPAAAPRRPRRGRGGR